MTPAWQPQWSKWAAAIVLAQVVGLIVYEVWALHESGDNWPTITALSVAVMREHWWAAVVILGTLGWLLVHFIRRLI
jgi:hypothetical protein